MENISGDIIILGRILIFETIQNLTVLLLDCTEIPITGVSTEPAYLPVDPGTIVSVTCNKGFNTGDSVITCNSFLYEDFGYINKRACVQISSFGKIQQVPNK